MVAGCWAFLAFWGSATALFGALPDNPSGNPNPAVPDYVLTVSSNLYSLHAAGAPVQAILRDIARASGIKIHVAPDLNTKINADLRDLPLDKLLAQLAESHAFVYVSEEDGIHLVGAQVTSRSNEKHLSQVATVQTGKTKARRTTFITNSDSDPAQLLRDPDTLLLRNAFIDTRAAVEEGVRLSVPPDLSAAENNPYFLVQFDHPVGSADRELLSGVGAEVLNYVPHRAYLVRIAPQLRSRLAEVQGVRYVTPYHPYFKLAPPLLASLIGVPDQAAAAQVRRGKFNVMIFPGAPDWKKELSAIGVSVGTVVTAGGRTFATVHCPPEKIRALAGCAAVQWIEPFAPPTLLNDIGNRYTHATRLRLSHPSLDGQGVIIGVMDTGIDFNHRTFAEDPSLPTTTGQNTRIVYYETRPNPESDGIPGDNVGHGTHVSGTILGNGALSETVVKAPGSGPGPYATNAFAGVAPAARLVMLEGFAVEGYGYTATEAAELEYSHGARISANSWGNPELFEYGTESAVWDALVRDADTNSSGNQQLIVFFAAGNDSYGNVDGTGGTASRIREQAAAKNVISVGALETPRYATNLPEYASLWESDSDWQVAWFSSRGPVSSTDLRVKPDIVAPGSFILSAQSKDTNPDEVENPPLPNRDYRHGNVDSGTNYAFMSGTSMATPIAAGAGALVYQYYTNTYETTPSPAMMKAILVNGARMVNRVLYSYPAYGTASTNIAQGWGMVDVSRAVDGPGLHDSDDVVWLDEDQTATLQTGEEYSYQYSVAEGEGGLKITLAWTDDPGTPGNAVQLVNDLDLIVIAPDGRGYVGNYFDSDGWSSAIVADPTNSVYGDRYNNVEQVVIPEPDAGTYYIRVIGHEVPGSGQKFALAIMKGISPVPAHTQGGHPAMVLDSNQYPIVAWSGDDGGGHDQIFVKRWQGATGDQSDIGHWKRLDERWTDMNDSARITGISKTLEDSEDPCIAVYGELIYVAWKEEAPLSGPAHIHLRCWNGTNWIELGQSAHDTGLSGENSYSASDPSISLTSNGLPIVAWRQPVLNGTEYNEQIRVVRWDGTNWLGYAGSDSNGIPGTGQSTITPTMISDAAGRPVIAWYGLPSGGGSPGIHVYRWDGSAWVSIGSPVSATGVQEPSLALAPNGDIYLTWVQFGSGIDEPNTQIYAAHYSGGGWHEFGGSMTYPGISSSSNTVTDPAGPAISIAPDGTVYVAWQAGNNDPNSLFLKKYSGGAWVGILQSDEPPGIARSGGIATNTVLLADGYGLPVVSYSAIVSGDKQIFTYRLVTDELPPAFTGLKDAAGGTNSNVSLSWDQAVDTSTTIYYHIYQSTNFWLCGQQPSCDADDVFNHEIAVVTNTTSYEVTGLQNDRLWCFGVRAEDTNGLLDANTVMHSAGPIAGGGDTDGDCLENSLEFAAGTEPCLQDTDGDGMWDGWEWTYSTNNPAHTNTFSLDPLDNGNDRVRTAEPDDGDPDQLPDADLDNDGASTLEEFEWWYTNTYLSTGCDATGPTNRSGPDPTNPDSDGDGMNDGWEIFNDLNPGDPSDGAVDADGDGVANSNEFAYGIDPTNPDSDSDGITDGDEIQTYGTDPSLPDTDRDGLDDGFELQIGSDPLDADSNDSGVSDGDTFQLGWDDPTLPITNFNLLLSENFEPSSPTRNQWTHYWTDGNYPYDFWHFSTAEPAPKTNTVVYITDHSTSTVYRMAADPSGTNVDATYSTGSIVQCALESPAIDASAVENLFVSWNEFYATEPQWDIMELQARAGSDSNWFVVSDTRSGFSYGWTNRVADLTRFAGMTNVHLRFFFAAQNSNNNAYAGWFVDDVRVYEGVTITGWVRDINGRPIAGAEVMAIGRGQVTNAVHGHRYVLPGKVFGTRTTTADGSYQIAGLPQGHYYLKASQAGYVDEFYNGPLFSGQYGFGNLLNPGVPDRDQVTSAGWVNLTGTGQRVECDFELEKGSGRGYLGVMLANGAGSSYEVFLNGLSVEIWNGVTNSDTNAPPVADLEPYRSSTNTTLWNNHPDWITNPVEPLLIADIAPGSHLVSAGTNLTLYPPAEVLVREGEISLVNIFTNQGEGRLYVTADDDGAYPVWLDGRDTGELTPVLLAVKAGEHTICIIPTNSLRVAPQTADVPLGVRVKVAFSTNDISGNPGSLLIQTVDVNGNAVTGATVYVDERRVEPDEVSQGYTNLTPTIVNNLLPGSHLVTVSKDGYAAAELRPIAIGQGIQSEITFVLHEADSDYDGVGDWTEISGYTNRFLYARDDDPDNDGLNNLFEFDQYRLFDVRLNIFNADSDGDGMPDGDELGYDGITNRLALSSLSTNAVQGTDTVRAYFVGRYLEGIDNFGQDHVNPAVECDRFEASTVSHPMIPVPAVDPALTVFGGIPPTVSERAVDVGHNPGAVLLADALPDQQDTDGDTLWDGFEFQFGRDTVAGLDPTECSDPNADPDYDGASNYREFLGADGLANTNDWSDPTNPDSDGDGMPDGWEYDHSLDPTDPSDAAEDSDSDGLANSNEYVHGTNPQLPDTDKDYLPDGPEVLQYQSNPLKTDTDGDHLIDGREVWDWNTNGVFDGGFFHFPSNHIPGDLDGDGMLDGPSDWDTDGDGMPDGFEVIDAFGNVRSPALDPYNPNDGDEDYDGDGLNNLEEYLVWNAQYGNPPGSFDTNYGYVVWDYSTDPFNPDSDGDGMPDGWEVIYGLHPMDPIPVDGVLQVRYPELGADGDVDHDGLFNEREYSVRFLINPGADSNSITEASTSPWNPDSDGDGLGDGEEDRSFRCSPVVQDTDRDGLTDGVSLTGHWAEVESAPRLANGAMSVSNHYDRALNDLWRLVWPKFQDLPNWEQVTPNTNNPLPEPRWGPAATYIPVFEIKTREIDSGLKTTNTVLLDNRQIVIIGGRDGVERFTNIWEFVIRSNSWVLSDATLDDIGLSEGLSEVSAVTLLGYFNTRADQCPCDNQPYYCDGTSFGLPKNRPWDNGYGRSSFDWTYILGGWDEIHNYYQPVPMPSYYYKSTDDQDPITEEDPVGAEGYNSGPVSDESLIQIGTLTEGQQASNEWAVGAEGINDGAVTNVTRVAIGSGATNGLFFDGLNIPAGSTIISANMDLNITAYGASTNNLHIVGELLSNGQSDNDYTNDPPSYRRVFSAFISSTQDFTISAADLSAFKTNIDITAIVTEMVARPDWAAQSAGFLIYGETLGASNELRVGESVLHVVYRQPAAEYDYNGFFFDDVYLRTNCEDILSAELVFDLTSTGVSSNDLHLRGELWLDGKSSVDYTGIPVTNRLTMSQFLSSELQFTVVVTGYTVVALDVTPIIAEMLAQDNWAAESAGFILWGDTHGSTLYEYAGKTTLRVTYRPGYKKKAYWTSGTHVQISGEMPGVRKSVVQVYDYKRDRIVAFGGIGGRTVYADTYEGTPVWNDLDGEVVYADPQSIGDPHMILWTKIIPAHSPPARWGHCMVYDPVDECVLLFGGFDADNRPLNDLWKYKDGDWSHITVFEDSQVPPPRGGASMIYFGAFMYDRGYADYCLSCDHQAPVLFGGTDGSHYFNDTWVYDFESARWIMVNPDGEQSQGPQPRAFAVFVFAQNAGWSPDPEGTATYEDLDPADRCATPAAYLFGGRCGTLPTSADTDYDYVSDGEEHAIGGPAAGHDPRVNALIPNTDTNESLPFCFLQIGSLVADTGSRGTIANLEALSYEEGDDSGDYAPAFDLPFQGYPLQPNSNTNIFDSGVDARLPQFTNLWYHRDGGDDPFGPGNAWELGIPNPDAVGTDAAPDHAHSGRWCFGTDLDGRYPDDAICELYSPLFSLTLPPAAATCSNNPNSFFLVFYEWLDLHDTNDAVRLDVICPRTPADILTRSGTNVVNILSDRNSNYNTDGAWRRVVVSLDPVANESNLYLRFTLQSDNDGNAGGWYIDDISILQGAEISGILSNSSAPFAYGDVAVFGGDNLAGATDVTKTDANGYFEFGLLPLGVYRVATVGTLFDPIAMSSTGWNYTLGTSSIPPLVVSTVTPGSPTAIAWPAVPGMNYQLEYTTNMITSPWQILTTITASSTNEEYLDYSTNGLRFYRVRFTGSP